MGGKHKQAQRIKNNARPSSSGRSAELLASSSGFTTQKEIRFVPPTLSLLKKEEFDSSVSIEFQLVFKKLNKKDTTTKLKALHEFSELIVKADDIKSVVTFWTSSFCVLATDTDHRVREAVHTAHFEVIQKDKIAIAPFLRQLIGPWFTSQYDTYPPAATAATKSFTTVFPSNKLQNCVICGQKEILSYIADNLSTKADQKTNATNEEAEAKYERIIISSLLGYCLYFNTLSLEQIEKFKDINFDILSNKFVTLTVNKSVSIRSAWFKVVATIYAKKLPFLSELSPKLISLVFNNLDESEPAVVAPLWESVVLMMDYSSDWSINFERQFLNKLKNILKKGCNGSASVIAPNLLTLLYHFPSSDGLELFIESFFDSLFVGLKRKNVIASKSETIAIVNAFLECLQFVLLKIKNDEKLGEKLLSNLLNLIDWSLKEPLLSYRAIYNQVGNLVQFLNRNLVKNADFFWSGLKNRFVLIESEYFERQICFLQHLKNVQNKSQRVKFENNEVSEEVVNKNCVKDVNNEAYFNELVKVVYVVLKSYINYMAVGNKNELYQHVYSLVQLYESKEFLFGLSQFLNCGHLFGLYDHLLLPMLNEDSTCETIVDLSFIIFKYLDEEDKKKMLENALSLSEKGSFVCFVKNAFSHPYNSDILVKKWLRNEQISLFLLKVTDRNLQEDCPSEYQLLFKLAFSEAPDGDLLIEKETVKQIIAKLQTIFDNPIENQLVLDSTAHLSAFISEIIYSELFGLQFGSELMLVLFELSLNDHNELEALTNDTLWEVTTSWEDALTILAESLPKSELLSLIESFANIILKHYLAVYKQKSFSRLKKILVMVFQAVAKSAPLLVNKVYKIVFKNSISNDWQKQVVDLAIIGEYLTKKVVDCKVEQINGDVDTVYAYFAWKYLIVNVVSTSIQKVDFDDDDEEDMDEIKLMFYLIDQAEELELSLLFDFALIDSIIINYPSVLYHEELVTISQRFQKRLKYLSDSIEIYKNFEQTVLQKLSTSYFWSKSIKILHNKIKPIDNIFTKFYKIVDSSTKLHFVNLFNLELSFDDVKNNSKCEIIEDVNIARNLLHCNEIDVQVAEIFTKLQKLRSLNTSTFLLDVAYFDSTSQELVEIIRFLAEFVLKKVDLINRSYWDFIVISLASWTTNCMKLKKNYQKIQFQALILSLTELFIAINKQIGQTLTNETKQFTDEWNDLFLSSIQSDLAQLWLYLADQFENIESYLKHQVFIQNFGVLTTDFNSKFLNSKSETCQKITKKCLNLFVHKERVLQLWGYQILMNLVPDLIEIDLESANATNAKGYCLQQLNETLYMLHSIVNAVLAEFKLGEDSCLIEPFTDSYTYTFGYLLIWRVILTFCDKSPPELRLQYADLIKNDTYFKSLLINLFKLMPAEILNNKKTSLLYQSEPSLICSAPPTSALIENLSCWIYSYALSQLPALVRQWWAETDTKITQIVDRVTANYVSPQLCQQELLDVARNETKFKNMTIKTINSVREVIAIYTVDEAQMELVITLPLNYPLGGPDVRCNRQIGGAQHKQWLMQLKKCLLHQNGRIWDGLQLWNTNLDKKFDGVEECYICFAVLHPGTYQLPKLSCQTCKKKFHSACLYKWFSTSNKSSCPICRNLF